MTESVGARRRSPFVERLDVVFANLFFAAVDARTPPRAWAPLFACRARLHVAPIQFALCGMNAHINRDLSVALVQTATELGVDLERDAAWVQGQVLWRLRALPPLERRYVDTLDRTVGFAGRGLVLPLPE